MKKILIIGICLLGIALVGTFALFRVKKPVRAVSVAQKAVVEDCSVTDEGVVSAVNKYRAEVGAKPLVFNVKLDDMANYRANEQNGNMDDHKGFRPYGDSHFLGDYFSVQSEVQNMVNGCYNSDFRVWYFHNSDKHWSALMNPEYDSVGVGYQNSELVIELGDLK